VVQSDPDGHEGEGIIEQDLDKLEEDMGLSRGEDLCILFPGLQDGDE